MRALVQFAGDLDARGWASRHAQGEVPDHTPFGLHLLADADTQVAFRPALANATVRTFARRVQGRCGGYDVVSELAGRARRDRRIADVVFCMDERAGIPAALLKARTPVVSGIAWIDEPPKNARAAALVRTALHRLDAIFSHGRAHLDSLAATWDLDPARLHLIDLGIDADHFAEQPFPHTPRTVFSVGDDRFRDFPTLVQAMTQLRERDPDVTLDLATTLPVEVPADLGSVHRQRLDGVVQRHIAAAAVVAVPNHHNRVCSGLTTILQTMAVGRAVVITASPGIETYVEDGVTGLLVPPNDPDAFAQALGSLLDDPNRARQMGQAGARRMRERFTSAHMAAQLRELLHRVA